MLIIFIILLTGILLGLSIGKISVLLKVKEGILTLTIYLILFMFAISTGIDDLIVKSIDSRGWNIFLLIIAVATAGTIIIRIMHKILSGRIMNSKMFNAESGKLTVKSS